MILLNLRIFYNLIKSSKSLNNYATAKMDDLRTITWISQPRTMGTGRRTDVVTVNMQWVDIKKIGYKFLLIADASFHHRPSGLDVYWVTFLLILMLRTIADLLGSTCTAPHRAYGAAAAAPPLSSRRPWVVVCPHNKMGWDFVYHGPFISLRFASTKTE